MQTVTVETFDAAGVTITRRETTSYEYDATGIRVASAQKTDPDGSGGSTVTTTTYLSDPQNPTGYAQTLEEVTKDGNGIETKRIVYTIGHDQISQTVYDAANPNGETHTFHADGHGSTRVLTDAVAAIVQHYAYDAHGNALGLDPAAALTSYLYSGEQFDSRIGQTYLRARWYDATTGRFNRLDPFFGNAQDPQSLHKYLYVHGDPVNGVDPSGMFMGLTGLGARLGAFARSVASVGSALGGTAARWIGSTLYKSLFPSPILLIEAAEAGGVASLLGGSATLFTRHAFAALLNYGVEEFIRRYADPMIDELTLLSFELKALPGQIGTKLGAIVDKAIITIGDKETLLLESNILRPLFAQAGMLVNGPATYKAFARFISVASTVDEALSNVSMDWLASLPSQGQAAIRIATGVDQNTRVSFKTNTSDLLWGVVFDTLTPHHDLHLLTLAIRAANRQDVVTSGMLITSFLGRLDDYGRLEVNPRPHWL